MDIVFVDDCTAVGEFSKLLLRLNSHTAVRYRRTAPIISWPQPTHKISAAEVLVLASVLSFDFFPTLGTRIIFFMLYVLSVLSYC